MTETTETIKTRTQDDAFQITIMTKLARMHHLLEEMATQVQELYDDKLLKEAKEYAEKRR